MWWIIVGIVAFIAAIVVVIYFGVSKQYLE